VSKGRGAIRALLFARTFLRTLSYDGVAQSIRYARYGDRFSANASPR
jgi:hypothetical protein